MHKKIIPLVVVFFCMANSFADTPGKATMYDSKISFQGIKNLTGYTFFWAMDRSDKTDTINNDVSLNMMSSRGAPYSYSFWGISNSTKKSTDTIQFSNYYSPDYVIILNAVKNDSIYYTRKELSNANGIVSEGNTDSIANKQLVADAMATKHKHYTKFGLFALAGAVALGGLIWFFVTRRKKKSTEHG